LCIGEAVNFSIINLVKQLPGLAFISGMVIQLASPSALSV